MQLPAELRQGILEITGESTPADLARATAELTFAYCGERKGRPQLERPHQAAYLISRLRATYAVISRVLREARERIHNLRVSSMLDLGAGPGTAMWAAAAHFSELSRIVLIEDESEWIAAGKRLAQNSKVDSIRKAEWRQQSVLQPLSSETFDIVTMSYVLNELRSADVAALASVAWKRTGKLLFLIEPGTPAGFARVREVRQVLVAAGAHMAAPCPHEDVCPMQEGNWCHFAERLERTSEHRQAKLAALGYEDEKYSYVIFAREPIALPGARILRHPQKHSGHLELELCTPHGLTRETVSKKHGSSYKTARKAGWGDPIENSFSNLSGE